MVRSSLDGPVKHNKGTVSNVENSRSTGVSDSEVRPVEKEKKKKVPEKKKGQDLVGLFKEFSQESKEEKK